MKKLQQLLMIILLSSNYCLSQKIADIEKLASSYHKTFDVLENSMNLKPSKKATKFGLESRVYTLNVFKVLVESDNEDNKISKISILTEKADNNDEIWYNITKAANANKDYKFVNSFISGRDDDIYEKDIDFNNMVNVLRKSKSLDDYIYSIVFKKDNIYYKFNIASKTFYMVINENID